MGCIHPTDLGCQYASHSLGIAEGLSLLSKGDVLISASCAPYSAQVVEVAETARRVGLQTIAITDRAISPLVSSSQAALLVPHESSFLSNSLGAFIVAAECLISACAAARPEQVRKALQLRDQMIERLGIEIQACRPYHIQPDASLR